jgi:hypothetical protein
MSPRQSRIHHPQRTNHLSISSHVQTEVNPKFKLLRWAAARAAAAAAAAAAAGERMTLVSIQNYSSIH